MNRETAALMARPARRSSSRPVPPVLIQVPTLAGREQARSPRLRPATAIGRRRRLRREVRMVGSGLLLGAAMASGILMLCGVRPHALARPIASVDRQDPAADRDHHPEAEPVSIRLESPVPMADPIVPVAFRGYLLPVDSQEEVRHAGG